MIKELTNDVFVHLVNLPDGARETVCPNEDGTYTIFISNKLSKDGQLIAYQHALKHIQEEDFSQSDVQSIEKQAHQENRENKISQNIDNQVESTPQLSDQHLKVLKRIRKQRKNIKNELEAYESRSKFIYDNFDTFKAAEYNWLYDED